MTPDLILHVLGLFIFCVVLAALEVQIEGKAGWAANLPAWKPSHSIWYARLYRKVMSGKDLDGYHILVSALVLIFLHYPYFTGKVWSLSSELVTMSFFFLIAIIWDFLWFVLNPYYGLYRFRAVHVWWHKKWFLLMPVDYYFGFIASALLYTRFSLSWPLLKEWFSIVGLLLLFTLAVVIFAIMTHRFGLRQRP